MMARQEASHLFKQGYVAIHIALLQCIQVLTEQLLSLSPVQSVIVKAPLQAGYCLSLCH